MQKSMGKEINWSLDHRRSEIDFNIRHLIVLKSRGCFKNFEAIIHTTDNNLQTIEIELSIDTSSVSTNNKKQDHLLRSPELLDILNHQQIRFVSGIIDKPDKNGIHILSGRLSIKGITRFVKFNVQFGKILNDSWGDASASLIITGKINRKDWGLELKTFTEKGVSLVSKYIHIYCKMEMSKINQRDIMAKQEQGIKNGQMVYSKKFNTGS